MYAAAHSKHKAPIWGIASAGRAVLVRSLRAALSHGELRPHAARLPLLRVEKIFLSVTDPRLLDEIGAKLSAALAGSPAHDVEKNVHALLASLFERFDLVTRDDFEVQKRILARARDRIAELEHRLVELEARSPGGSAGRDV